jgi:hypothetical protein
MKASISVAIQNMLMSVTNSSHFLSYLVNPTSSRVYMHYEERPGSIIMNFAEVINEALVCCPYAPGVNVIQAHK